jgi:arylformamidase
MEPMESEYNVRLLHPDRNTFHERGRAFSRAAYRELAVMRDVRYGTGPRALLDLFPAGRETKGEGVPVVAFFHGGYWHAHERSDFGFVARAFSAAGIATAIVGYDLAPQASMGAIVAQAREACAWIRAHAQTLGVDAGLVFSAGHSAGAHLAACALTESDSSLRGAILVSGIFDLTPLLRTTLNEPLGLTAAAARRWSPARHRVPDAGDALIVVGAFETSEFIRQSRDLARLWDGGERRLETMVVPALHHYNVVLELADPDSALSRVARHLVLRAAQRGPPRRRVRP